MQRLTKVFEIKGRDIRVFSRRFLARMVGKANRTLMRWEKDGIVPKPIFEFNDPFHWYLADEVDIWVRAYCLDDVRAGVPLMDSYFSLTVHAETRALLEKFNMEGVYVLGDGMDLAAFVKHIKEVRDMLDWKKQRALRGERRRKK